jgi:hypothetical protein
MIKIYESQEFFDRFPKKLNCKKSYWSVKSQDPADFSLT